jgi:hypothetical protein
MPRRSRTSAATCCSRCRSRIYSASTSSFALAIGVTAIAIGLAFVTLRTSRKPLEELRIDAQADTSAAPAQVAAA